MMKFSMKTDKSVAAFFAKSVRRGLLVLLLLASHRGFAQGFAISGQLLLPTTGKPAAYAPIRVCSYSGAGIPCSPLSAIYSDLQLTHQISNPFSTDQYGNYTFFVTPGNYFVQSVPFTGVTYSYVVTATVPVNGVISFNTRVGAVVPVPSDYTPAFIGAVNKAGDTGIGPLESAGWQLLLAPPITGGIAASGAVGARGTAESSIGGFTIGLPTIGWRIDYATGPETCASGTVAGGMLNLQFGAFNNALPNPVTACPMSVSPTAPQGSLLINSSGSLTNLGNRILTAAGGFTGTKTAGACVFTIVAGQITNVTGC